MPAPIRQNAQGHVLFDPAVLDWASVDATTGLPLVDPDLSGAMAYLNASGHVVMRTEVYPQRLAPDAIISASNLSGAVGAVQDDPDSPDANWLTYP